MPFLTHLGWLQAAIVRHWGMMMPTGRHQQRQWVSRPHWVQERLAYLAGPPLCSLLSSRSPYRAAVGSASFSSQAGHEHKAGTPGSSRITTSR